MAYSVFIGSRTAEQVLPNWLADAYDKVYEDEYRYWVTDQIKLIGADQVPFDEVLIEGHDIFLRNSSGRVARIAMPQFENELEIIADGTVAPKKYCHEYFIFDPGVPYDDWDEQERFVIDYFMPMEETVYIKMGENKYAEIPYAMFADRYYYLGSGIDWNRFYE